MKLRAIWSHDLALLFLATLLLFCLGLTTHNYLVPSEARYIELPRQMLATHDFLTPRINGVPYFEKPPLFYWMQALALATFGLNEFGGRIMTVLLSSLICMGTFALAKTLYGRLAGWLAAGMLAFSLLGFGLSHVSMLDVPVTCFITLVFVSFLTAVHTGNRNFYWGMYVAAALAVLTKGLIGIVVPGMVIGAWILFTRRWSILKEAKLIPGLLLFLLIAAPWHILMHYEHPGFSQFYFIHEHFERYISEGHKREKPFWFFAAITVVGLLPWTGLLPAASKNISRRNPTDLFLLLWVLLPFLFFSTSHSQLLPYIFPIFPPLCILLSRYACTLWQQDRPERSLWLSGVFMFILLGAMIALGLSLPYLPLPDSGKFVPTALPFAVFLLPVAGLLGLGWALFAKRPARQLLGALAASSLAISLTLNDLATRFDNVTIKPLAEELLTMLKDGDKVVSYGTYFQDLPPYINRNVTVVAWRGELDFGISHYPEVGEWMLSTDAFNEFCVNNKQFYLFAKHSATLPQDCPLVLIDSAGRNRLYKRVEP